MLPRKLRLRNFLSYGNDEVTLDLTPLRVACLSGENGAGKSALFDAITWALWGQARGFNQSDELIHRGADYMEVELHFETAAGDVYRAFRIFDRSKTSGQNLAYLHRVEGGDLELIAEKVRSVDNAIHDLIRVEHDTFLASAYLRQGDADYFTNTSKLQKRQRKELLIDLLDLGRFEPLSASAKSAAAQLKSDMDADQSVLDILKERVGQIPEAESELSVSEKKADAASKSYEKYRKSYDEIRGRLQRFTDIKLRSETLNEEIAEINDNIRDVTDKIVSLGEKKSEFDEVLNSRDRIKEDYDTLVKLEEKLREYDRKFALLSNLEEERRKLKGYEDERRHVTQSEYNEKKSNLNVIENDLNRLKETISKEKDIRKGAERFNKLGEELEKLKTEDTKRRGIKDKIAEIQAGIEVEIKGIETTLLEKEKLIGRYESELAKIDEIEEKIEQQEGKLARARKWLGETEECRKEVSDLENQTERCREKIANAQKKLQDIEERRNLLETGETTSCPVCDREFDDKSHKAAAKHISTELELAQNELEKARKELTRLLDKLETAKADLDGYEEKNAAEAVEKIAETLTENKTKLGELTKRQEEADNVKTDIKEIKKAIAELYVSSPEASELGALRKELEELTDTEDAIVAADKERNETAHYPAELERLEKAKADLKELEKAEKQLRSELEKLQEMLRGDFFKASEKTKLEKIGNSLEELGYDRSVHGKTRTAFEEKAESRERYEALKKADGEVKAIDRELDLLEERRTELRVDLKKCEAENTALRKEVNEYVDIEEQADKAESRLRAAEQDQNEANEKLGAARHRLTELREAEGQIKERESLLTTQKEDFRVYSYLEKAFGRDGIPTLMLERGLEELEEIANDILDGLTNGRISLGIRTEASKKSGKGTKDVFDVEVSDNGVARQYGLFSGGERFRVDFALRVALSQLLARRAGAPLQFLIIDEGFGTQDPGGLIAMVEAINEISSRFELILVISHLPALRDQFPTRIEISKDGNGISSFEVVGA